MGVNAESRARITSPARLPWLVALLLMLCSPQLLAAYCSDVFPRAIRQNASPPDVLNLPSFPSNNDGAFTINNNGSATLAGGDYYFTSFTTNNNAELTVNGPVRIFVQGTIDINNGSDINAPGEASDLVLVSYGSATIGNNTTMNGILYGQGSVNLGNGTHINGAITAEGPVNTHPNANVSYDATAVHSAGFGTLCDPNVVLFANGQSSSPVTVNTGETVNLEAQAANCPSFSPDAWRDRWVIDGASEPYDYSGQSACNRSPITNTTSFATPGTYQIEFTTDYCRNVFFIWCLSGWDEHGRDTITIEVTNAPVGPDHIRLLHSGQGLTCSPTSITVQACADAACSSLYTDSSVVVDFTSPAGNWSPNPATFTGSTNVSLQYTSPGAVTLDAQAPTAINSTRCFDGGTETCEMIFHNAGFVFDVPDHVAATTRNVDIAAVRTDDTSQECVPGFANETKTVNFWSGYQNPATGSQSVSIDGTPILGSSPGTPVTLSFDGSGVATFDLNYPDAGLVALDARYEGSSGQEAGLVMVGQDSFVARPAWFQLNVPGNPGASDENGGLFAAAGEDFQVEISARNAAGNITLNFGRESPPATVNLQNNLVGPSGGNNPAVNGFFGAFGEDCDGNAAPAGTACGHFNWTEVGIVTLTPQLGSYLGGPGVTGNTSGNVGRFSPHHFDLSEGDITDRAALSCTSNFTHIGERFEAIFTLRARSLGGLLTTNYESGFAKLDATELNPGAVDDGTDLSSDLVVEDGVAEWTGGVGDITLGLHLARTTPAGPYDTFELGVDPRDDDGVELATLDLDVDADGTDGHGKVADTELRFARLALDNAIGSELAPLDLPLRNEFWDGNTWALNTEDNCTSLDLASQVQLTSDDGATGTGLDTMTLASGGSTNLNNAAPVTLSAGEAAFTFSAPGTTGWVELELLLATEYSFLRDDLDDDDVYQENPGARASFGLFEGEQERIFIQEIAPQ